MFSGGSTPSKRGGPRATRHMKQNLSQSTLIVTNAKAAMSTAMQPLERARRAQGEGRAPSQHQFEEAAHDERAQRVQETSLPDIGL